MRNLGKESNVIKYRRPFNVNIGVIIFAIIFIYFMFNVLMYLTDTHIAKYEVGQGTMAANNIYNGLIIRDETVYTSDYKGAVNYYVQEYSKVGYNDLIYSVDENGSVSNKLNAAKQEVAKTNTTASEGILELLDDFQLSYDKMDFYKVYALKDEMNSLLNEALSLDALNQIAEYANNAEGKNTFHRIRAVKDGIVSYYVDGYEGVTIDTFDASMLNEADYQRTNLKVNAEVSTNAPVYKMINSETWHIVLPITSELADELSEKTVIRIRFVKDEKEMYANCTIQENADSPYLILTMKNAMIRYASERYLEIELLLTEKTGLKIPNSAITEKEFYTIPKEYFLKGDDSNQEGLLLEKTDKNGNTTTEFINPTIYYQTETHSYIDSEYVQSGDVLVKQNSKDRYLVGKDTASLQGVYNINKGYAVFKQIKIMFQNEEYAIIETGTSYGIALYDHIALDGSKIQEDELIK